MAARVAILTPFASPSVRGNAITAERIARGLRERGVDLSDCLASQAGCHGRRSRSMALRIVRSLRMAAVRATFPGRPAATRRW